MNLWDFFMISGGLFSLLIMTGILVQSNKTSLAGITAIVYFCHAAIVINKGLACSGIVYQYTAFMHVDLVFFYLIGPAIYLYLKAFSERDFSYSPSQLPHLIPVFCMLVVYIPFFALSPAEKVVAYPFYRTMLGTEFSALYTASYIAPAVLVILYTVFGLKGFPEAQQIKEIVGTKTFWATVSLAIAVLFCALMMIASHFFWSWNIYRFIMNGLNIIIVIFYLIDKRSPQLHSSLQGKIQDFKTRSSLESLDIPHLKAELDSLLNTRKVYTDPELTLVKMAGYMNITPHQLSEFLNRKQREGFKSLINRYRIQHICERFRLSPEKRILELAFEAGFNSKSSFNACFRNVMNATPKAYRDSLSSQYSLRG